ncbi:hypothetical protein ACSZNA_22735, partial [Aeromonas hydrophila]
FHGCSFTMNAERRGARPLDSNQMMSSSRPMRMKQQATKAVTEPAKQAVSSATATATDAAAKAEAARAAAEAEMEALLK